MPTISDNEVTKLERLIVKLQGFVTRLKSQGVKLTPQQEAHIEKMREKKLCLVCELPWDGEIRRGSHHSCYNGISQLIDTGELSVQEAVNQGKWNPTTAKPGRKGKYRKAVQKGLEMKKVGTKAGTEKT